MTCNNCGKDIQIDGSVFVRTYGNAYHMDCEHALQKTSPRVYISTEEDAMRPFEEPEKGNEF